jgi:hypothetical protein
MRPFGRHTLSAFPYSFCLYSPHLLIIFGINSQVKGTWWFLVPAHLAKDCGMEEILELHRPQRVVLKIKIRY